MTRLTTWLLLGLALGGLLAWGVRTAHTDLWWDEITSFEGYVLPGLHTVATSYVEPNNHVLFNLLDGVLVRLLGIGDLDGVMENVAVFRWVQWFLALAAVAYVGMTAHRAWGMTAGALAALLLVTTLPFLGTSMQLRGYNLGILGTAGILYHASALFGSPPPLAPGERSSRPRTATAGTQSTSLSTSAPGGRSWWPGMAASRARFRGLLPGRLGQHAGGVALFTFVILYTVPSHLYFVIALGAVGIVVLLRELRTQSGRSLLHRPTRVHGDAADAAPAGGHEGSSGLPVSRESWAVPAQGLLAALVFGAGLAVLAYAPILGDVLDNRFVSRAPTDRFFVFSTRFLPVLDHLTSYRYALLVLALAGLATVRGGVRGDGRLAALLALLVLPFVVAFLQNAAPFERTFAHLAPVLALLLAGSIRVTAETFWPRRPSVGDAFFLGIGLYAAVTAVFAWPHVEGRLTAQFRSGDHGEQNLLANSYLARTFRPGDLAIWLAAEQARHPGPVLLAYEADRVATASYLRRHGVASYALIDLAPADPAIAGEGMTHTASFQRMRPGEAPLYFGAHLHLPGLLARDRLSPILQAVHRYDPAPRYYLATDFPAWLARLPALLPAGWEAEMARETEGFGTVVVLTPPR